MDTESTPSGPNIPAPGKPEDRYQAALDSLVNGTDIDEAIGETPAEEQPQEVSQESVESETDELSTTPSQDDTIESEGDSQEQDSNSEEVSSDIEEIFVKGPGGRRQKVKVDYSDKDKIKRAHMMAAGMRKFQTERDQERQWRKEKEPRLKELEETWSSIEDAYKNQGIRGLVNLIAGEDSAYEKHIQQEYQRYQARENASPDEIEKLDLEEKLQRIERENQRWKQQLEEQQKKVQSDREEADYRALEADVHPAFNKYRFSGKIEDAQDAEELDSILWERALDKLASYDEEGQEVNPAVIDREFRVQAKRVQQLFGKQAKKVAKKITQKKQAAAQQKVAMKTRSGIKSASGEDDARSKVQGGDFVGGFRSLLGL